MSNNYELIQSLTNEPEIGRVERMKARAVMDTATAPAPVRMEVRQRCSALSHMDDPGRNEIAKVVQGILALKNGGGTKVVFAGVDEDAGCSVVCASTAEMLASLALGTVCLIDANFRTPSVHLQFGLEMPEGLLNAGRSEVSVEGIAHPVNDSNLYLVSAGLREGKTGDPQLSEQIGRIITLLFKRFDHVLVHTSNASRSTDALTIGRTSDGVVMIIEANVTRRETLRRISGLMKVSGVPVLGAILNNRSYPIPDAIYKRL